MVTSIRKPLILLCLAAGAVIAIPVVGKLGVFNTETWTREPPLVNALTVTDVNGGSITLSDGRTCRPAGVRRRDGVTQEIYDQALRAILAQGVLITRDLGDGRCFLLAEPKFRNWCGTRGYGGNPWGHWAGEYMQCPVSELLIGCSYGDPALEESGLTAKERWKLQGVRELMRVRERPDEVLKDRTELRFDVDLVMFRRFEENVELMWKPPPE